MSRYDEQARQRALVRRKAKTRHLDAVKRKAKERKQRVERDNKWRDVDG